MIKKLGTSVVFKMSEMVNIYCLISREFCVYHCFDLLFFNLNKSTHETLQHRANFRVLHILKNRKYKHEKKFICKILSG